MSAEHANEHADEAGPEAGHDDSPANPTPGGALTGSVKVDDVDLDNVPANGPHQACQLRIAVRHPADGPLQLTFEAQPPTTRAGDTTYARDLHVMMERGDIDGASFMFTVAPNGEHWTLTDTGTVQRTINHIGDLYDVMLNSWLHGRKDDLRIYGPPDTERLVNTLVTQVYDKDIAWRDQGEPSFGGWKPVVATDIIPGPVLACVKAR